MKRAAQHTPPPAWDLDTLRAPHVQPDKAARVESMFDAIAGTYECVNSVTSLGQDARWRARTVRAADVRAGDVVLDVCCGTGDMVRAFARAKPAPRLVMGVDFSAEMLGQGRFDGLPTAVQVVRADAQALPLGDATVDVISCTFGIRNFADLQVGLNEMGRVSRPGARVVILEFATPENPLIRWGYRLYCEQVLPRLAAWLSGDRVGAYRYLARSIRTFESAVQLRARLEVAGFTQVTAQLLNWGGVVLLRGVRAG